MKRICENERHYFGCRLYHSCCALAYAGGTGRGGSHAAFGDQKRKTLSGGVLV